MPTGPRKYDPKAVEHEYVTGDISLRALAAAHGVSFSSLAAYARKEDWAGKKVAYNSALSRKTYEAMAAEAGNVKGVILEDSIKVLRATLTVFAEGLAARKIPISPKDAMDAIRTLAVLLGQEEGGAGDDRNTINVTPARSVDADFLRRVAETARGQIATDSVLGGAAPGESPGTRPN
jgi:hypothetical protein